MALRWIFLFGIVLGNSFIFSSPLANCQELEPGFEESSRDPASASSKPAPRKPPTNPGRVSSSKIWVLLKSDQKCGKCRESRKGIRQLVQSALAHQGLSPLWGSLEEVSEAVGDEVLSEGIPSELEKQSSSAARRKNAVGSLVIQWYPTLIEDEDSLRAIENHYLIRAYFQIGEMQGKSQQQQVQEEEAFEGVGEKMIASLLNEVGVKPKLGSNPAGGPGIMGLQLPSWAEQGHEILIEITGFRDFTQFQQAKSRIQEKVSALSPLVLAEQPAPVAKANPSSPKPNPAASPQPDLSAEGSSENGFRLEDRRFSKGRATLAIVPTNSGVTGEFLNRKEEIKKKVKSLSSDPEIASNLRIMIL